MSRQQDEQAKRRWLAIQEELDPGETETSRTLSNIAVVKAGLYRVRNEAGEYAYFPDMPVYQQGSKEARAAEDRWQERAGEMHSAQVPIRLEPKPLENTLAARVVRSD